MAWPRRASRLSHCLIRPSTSRHNRYVQRYDRCEDILAGGRHDGSAAAEVSLFPAASSSPIDEHMSWGFAITDAPAGTGGEARRKTAARTPTAGAMKSRKSDILHQKSVPTQASLRTTRRNRPPGSPTKKAPPTGRGSARRVGIIGTVHAGTRSSLAQRTHARFVPRPPIGRNRPK